ncbi:MAG: TonB-dependent receptor [Ignavibacteriales bacterium]|nr:TonB-dependent receptor [Ignavibacteriales bacterium]
MKKHNIIIFGLFLLLGAISQNLHAQKAGKTAVSGFVYDHSNGEALIGATIFIPGENAGSSSNNSGYFVINNISPGKHTLKVSYMGYKTISIEVDTKKESQSPMSIQLEPSDLRVNEVIISGEKEDFASKLYNKPVSKFSMSSREINSIPKVIEADLLRALQTMPGITALSDFSSALYVRGGTPDQNLYLIDGADVYNPDHAFGIFSTFNTNAIKKVDVSKGGFSSEYGGRLSSVIDVTNLDGNRNNMEGVVNVSLLSASATVQVPVGSIGSLSGSLRRTYIDKTYAKWNDDIPAYYFYDGNLKGFFDITEKDKLSLSFFKSNDNLNYKIDKKANDSPGFTYEWGNTTGSANLKHIFSPELFASFWATMSEFKSEFAFDKIIKLGETNKLTDRALKVSLEYYPDNDLSVKFGAEHKFLDLIFKEDFEDGVVDISQNSTMTTAYIDAQWKPDALWSISGGLRAGRFKSEKTFTDLEPRFSAKYRLSTDNSLKFAYGSFHQYVNRIPRLFFASIWATADANTKPSAAEHYIFSFEQRLPNNLQLEAEVYYKKYHDLYEFNQNLNTEIKAGKYNEAGKPVYNSTQGIFRRGDGNSRGFELLLRKEAGTVTGWVSYTYAQTKHTFDGINQGKEYAPRHDRGNVVNLVLNGEFGSIFSSDWNTQPESGTSKWLLGLNFIYASGQPLTIPSSAYYVHTVPTDDNGTGNNIPGYKLYPQSINTYRLPAYVRMDVSVTYEKSFGGWSIAPYLQIFNIGNRKNLWFIDYQSEGDGNTINQKVEKVNMLPLLPSLGINIKF